MKDVRGLTLELDFLGHASLELGYAVDVPIGLTIGKPVADDDPARGGEVGLELTFPFAVPNHVLSHSFLRVTQQIIIGTRSLGALEIGCPMHKSDGGIFLEPMDPWIIWQTENVRGVGDIRRLGHMLDSIDVL